ncbi:MAG: hypothetical protein GTO45_40680, partial [Candidatus Aminicenantes bacterium]|nr:hypothetical protein [Candidatus Aminicenantes bacterium]NIM82049.1 hypothetical protein [Candidatus Aminicenantes bacterium]NIN24434.1 hypothetical protein [Candidatus Aminicenantes bacterium]NIN48198.1 hypothetical protein [Candidatus Aminicenantes bacterium]NIN91101.1 hypothetical protein [Candidatus Aminicenantes bacterium]
MNTKGAYRYPGSRPFEDTDIDRKLFFGRDREKEELLQKVLARRLVVLFAKSGLGKTSLINAGLNQLLRKNGCVPLKVRFNDVNMSPVQTVFAGIKKMAEQHHVDYEHGEENTLWQYFKTAAFWSPEDTLLTPVLILDQFEEFFAFHEPESRKTFVAQLADLVNGAIPAALRQSVEKGEAFPYTESPPNVKVLISIREDYLGQLEELSREISDILKNRFRLQALSREQAREAITKPSQVKDDKIQTPIFSYDSSTVKRMLVFLSVWMEKNKVVYKDEVESFQLQLLCQHIEEKVRRKTQEGDEIIIKEDDLSGMPGMQKVLQNFYDDRIKRLRGVRKKINVRKLCEKGLISLSDRRLSLEEEEIGRRFKVSPSLLAEMVDGRLLRAEKRVGSVYYELSHDTLVAPIRESQRKRRIGTSKIVGLVLIPVLIVIAIFYQSQMNKPQSKNESSRPSEAGDIKSTSKYKKATAIYSKITKYDQKNVEVYRELGDIFV